MINIENKKNCCGCTACFSICPKHAITMVEDYEGFKYPKINKEKCINCGLCEKVCPIINKKNINSLKKALIIRTKNFDELGTSTSGGFFTPISKYIIKNDGYVFGAIFDKDKIVHKGSNDLKLLELFRGSKYVQSDLKNTFVKIKKLLQEKHYVLFSGTPCQVAGLKNYLQKDYENLLTIDVICHGTPSPLLFRNYVNYMENKYNSKINKINFRNKTYGYHAGTMKIKFDSGKNYYGSARIDYMLKSFFNEISSRPACYDCKFKNKNHISDFTIYDCWSADKLNRNVKDDDKGFTNLIINSKKGEFFFEKIKDMYEVYNSDFNKAIELDGIMVENSAIPHPKREKFYVTLNNKGLEYTIKEFIPIRKKDYIIENTKVIIYKLKLIKVAQKIKELIK